MHSNYSSFVSPTWESSLFTIIIYRVHRGWYNTHKFRQLLFFLKAGRTFTVSLWRAAKNAVTIASMTEFEAADEVR